MPVYLIFPEVPSQPKAVISMRLKIRCCIFEPSLTFQPLMEIMNISEKPHLEHKLSDPHNVIHNFRKVSSCQGAWLLPWGTMTAVLKVWAQAWGKSQQLTIRVTRQRSLSLLERAFTQPLYQVLTVPGLRTESKCGIAMHKFVKDISLDIYYSTTVFCVVFSYYNGHSAS